MSVESLSTIKQILAKINLPATSPNLAADAAALAKLNREVDALLEAQAKLAPPQQSGPRISQ